MKKIFCLSVFTFLLLSCEDQQIKQIRIDLLNDVVGDQGTSSTTGYIFTDEIVYKDFSLQNYPNVSSVIFQANIKTTHPDRECMLELYNLTDLSAIPDSRIATTSLSSEWVESGNLVNSFPDHPADLTISLISGFPGLTVYVSSAFLYIYMD
jgi:hypothetical protein